MNADGSKNRFLVRGSGARWSPSGDRIVYTAQGDPKGSQIFVRYMDAEGATSQITHLTESPANVTWSPDGQSIAFAMKVEKKNVWSIKMPERPEGAKWIETPRIVERLDYRQDGQGFNDDGFRHLFTVPATGGTPRQLTNGDWDHNGIEFTPDGKQILFTSLRVPDADYQWRESEIYSVNVDSGAITQLTRRKGPDNNPKVSPDGKLRRLHGHRRVAQHLDRQQAVRDEHRRQQSAPGLRRLGSLAAERAVEGRRHRRLLHRAGSAAARTSTCCRWPASAPTWCSRSPRAPTCSRRRACRRPARRSAS